jgi:hypothetical protein
MSWKPAWCAEDAHPTFTVRGDDLELVSWTWTLRWLPTIAECGMR